MIEVGFLPGMKVIEKTVSIPDIAAGGSGIVEVVFNDDRVIIVGVPEISVSVDTLNTMIMSGGQNKIKVLVENTDTVNVVSGATMTVKAIVIGAL